MSLPSSSFLRYRLMDGDSYDTCRVLHARPSFKYLLFFPLLNAFFSRLARRQPYFRRWVEEKWKGYPLGHFLIHKDSIFHLQWSMLLPYVSLNGKSLGLDLSSRNLEVMLASIPNFTRLIKNSFFSMLKVPRVETHVKMM